MANPEIVQPERYRKAGNSIKATIPGAPTESHRKILLLSIIAQAVDDVRRYRAGKRLINDHGRTAGLAALEWIASKDFESTCDMADIDAGAVRRALSASSRVDRLRRKG